MFQVSDDRLGICAFRLAPVQVSPAARKGICTTASVPGGTCAPCARASCQCAGVPALEHHLQPFTLFYRHESSILLSCR